MHIRALSIKMVSFYAVALLSCAALNCVRAEDKELSLDLGKGIKLDLVLIPAGTFEMGSPETEAGRKKSETSHAITLTRPFYMSKYEITQEVYEAIMSDNPSRNKGPALPVERVTWDEATKFCEKLSEKFERIAQLPTEAQWEYACRAETKTPFNTGDTITTADANFDGSIRYPSLADNASAVAAEKAAADKAAEKAAAEKANNTAEKPNGNDNPEKPPDENAVPEKSASEKAAADRAATDKALADKAAAWKEGENRGKTLPAGTFKPNAFGLYDMHGNVWEWCRDWYDENYYANSPAQDPEGPEKSSNTPPTRVLRGGSYYSGAGEVRSACRDNLEPIFRNLRGGFRIVISTDKKE